VRQKVSAGQIIDEPFILVASMSYAAAIGQLNAMVPELHTGAGYPRRKFSLDEIRTLLGVLGNPHLSFPSILIAGTNGKGSTAATLASILEASGLRTGLYTSPHLERPNERIRVDCMEIDDATFARLYFRVQDTAQKLVLEERLPQLPSYFELLTALGFLYFAETNVQVAVLEVGMGGRLDATNIVDPLISIITDISLDHMEWLGPTISTIAREKAGILRPSGTMITLPQHPEANQVLGEVATELRVKGVSATPYVPSAGTEGSYRLEVLGEAITVDSPLAGEHQHRNIALAITAAAELASQHGFRITPGAIAEGIRRTSWPGRLEQVERADRRWILDVAHNPAGAWALRAGLRMLLHDERPRTLIFSCLRDKPVAEMSQILFPMFERVILAPIHASRATSVDDLLAAAMATGTDALAVDSVREAIDRAQNDVGDAKGVVVISGSVYLVGEARAILIGGHGASG
jgi:dihydrofolate synthase / folylpolyglutamate synthase